jgi:AdoMet-dependent rRNA methyltransferase SPB1
VADQALITAEAVTLAQRLVNRETTATHLINDGFNRYSLNSKEDLPSWFLDDEAQHYKPNIPVTKEAIAALRARQKALDARPIKKVAEAKARKKMKAAQRLEKAMKKAQGVNDASDMTEKEKAQQIEKLMRKGAAGTKKRKEVKVVVAKGTHKGIKGRPKGVKGRYQMVDARMRKEVGINDLLNWEETDHCPRCAPKSGKRRQTRSESAHNVISSALTIYYFMLVRLSTRDYAL